MSTARKRDFSEDADNRNQVESRVVRIRRYFVETDGDYAAVAEATGLEETAVDDIVTSHDDWLKKLAALET